MEGRNCQSTLSGKGAVGGIGGKTAPPVISTPSCGSSGKEQQVEKARPLMPS